MRETIIAGNWKMNTNPWEGVELARGIIELLTGGNGRGRVTVVLFPPATHLVMVRAIIGAADIGLGSQNVHWEDSGAFTGEISAPSVKFLGCSWCIIGHSERRQYFGETDETVNRRLKKALEHGLRPIVCIGERLEEREAGDTFKVLERQLRAGLDGVPLEGEGGLVIAYEPIWAIGTGRTATPQQAQEVHAFIRRLLTDIYDTQSVAATVIQYGGSVNDVNATELLAQPDVDGALVGGASLNAEKFTAIVNAARPREA